MGLIGSIAGGALGAVGGIFGGISASKAMKKVKRNIEAQKKANEDWYNRRYNEDATQRADAQRILTMTEETIKNRNKAASGTAAVMGGTEESVAAAKAAGNEAMANAASQIAAAGDTRKDTVEAQYLQKDAALDDALNNMEMKKAQAISTAVQGVAQAGGGMASAF